MRGGECHVLNRYKSYCSEFDNEKRSHGITFILGGKEAPEF